MVARSSLADWEALGSRRAAVNGIELAVVDHGQGPPVVLCHGFPELGYSWRHQVRALADAGHRVLVPDMRGYGASSRPEAAGDYDILTICGDLAGLLDDIGADEAVFVGHDWGASIVWSMALLHPGRVRAVAGLSVPVSPRPPVPPLPILRRRLGDDFYICWFQEPGVADAVLNRDVRRTLLGGGTHAPAWTAAGPVPGLPSWQSEEDFGVFLRTFERTGFTGGLNYYRNMDRNWSLTEHTAGRTIDRPSLFLIGADDVVADFMPSGKLAEVLTDLRGHVVVEGAGHWVQQERPDEVNAALLDFLASLDP
ncbi:alpha/beta hydrolase [Actinocorallia longicatena]|uniref:Epoxide hydrolase EphA n=1 Tax=Actinocorallia longicatena TaxID=111803 RepID=A0ABP6QA74_9ACTN